MISSVRLDNTDKQKIDFLRKWSFTHFKEKKSIIFNKETKLINRSKFKQNLDLMVKVTSISEVDSGMIFYVQDDTDKCSITTSKYFRMVEVDDLIRIRGVYENNLKELCLYDSSNILTIPKVTYLYNDYNYRLLFNNKEHLLIKDKDFKNNKENKNESEYDSQIFTHTNIKNIFRPSSLPEFNIKQLSSLYELNDFKDEKYFLINASLLKFEPENIKRGIKRTCKGNCILGINKEKGSSILFNNIVTSEWYDNLNKTAYIKDQSNICSRCNTEFIYFFDFDLFLLINPFSGNLLKVQLCNSGYKGIVGFEGDGIIPFLPEEMFYDCTKLEKYFGDLCNLLIVNTYCVDVKDYKIVGKYTNELNNQTNN